MPALSFPRGEGMWDLQRSKKSEGTYRVLDQEANFSNVAYSEITKRMENAA